ncbi:hypothetical protein Moror_2426 [Moniliophthora roreri MCA 2997]|uniref:Uncharacterized protein n=1 Tax=Moniliophthora roreri (strain MCA 2997) TaxID=1381753 RepID=V2Y2B6_MONRO|nr:hypothetical protein Moror_2426 [Moniliophthora roreri MCA 2997]
MSEAAVEKLSETVPTTQKTTTGDVEIGNDEEKMKKDRAVRQGIFLTLSPSSVLNSLMKFYFLDPKLPHYKFMCVYTAPADPDDTFQVLPEDFLQGYASTLKARMRRHEDKRFNKNTVFTEFTEPNDVERAPLSKMPP